MVITAWSPSRRMLCDLAARVGPDHVVAELEVREVLPVGHFDGRGAVAFIADQLRTLRQTSTARRILQELPAARVGVLAQLAATGTDRPDAADVQLAEVVQVGLGLPATVRVGLPAGDRLAAADDRGLFRRRAVDHVVAAGSRVVRLERRWCGRSDRCRRGARRQCRRSSVC